MDGAENIGMTRREFLKSSLAALGFMALPGARLFAAPAGWKKGREPRLVFGLLSDTHLRTARDGKSQDKGYTDRYFISALEYFREQDVDAVVHLGDFANNAQIDALQFHADAWNAVFTDGKGRDGRKVEKLFVMGNHDIIGQTYGTLLERFYPDPDDRRKHIISTDTAGNWERVWGEKFEDVWHKTVKGYHFFGRHWCADAASSEGALKRLVEETKIAAGAPFFLLSHERPSASFVKGLGAARGAIALHGHNHHSATNWNVIRFLSNPVVPVISCPACHSSRGEGFFSGDSYISKAEISGGWNWDFLGRCRQGLVFRIYDDMLVISRREFSAGGSLGPDWVLPFGDFKAHPFSKKEMKKLIGIPQFRDGAKLEIKMHPSMSRGVAGLSESKYKKSDVRNPDNPANTSKPDWNAPCLRVTIPHADGNPDSRVYAYEIAVVSEEAGKEENLLKATYACGCNMGMGHETNGGVTIVEIPKAELPQGMEFGVAVRPLSSLGTAGRPIAEKLKI